MIRFTVKDESGVLKPIEVPEGINLSLMEVLKASGYGVLATCGGMALCATCLVDIISGADNLPPATDQEMDMLDILPDTGGHSRLACQLRVDENMNGMVIRLKESPKCPGSDKRVRDHHG